MTAFLSTNPRTHSCGALRADDVGKRVVLTGWVHSRRVHAGVLFVDLRDRDGMTQLVFDPAFDAAVHEAATHLRNEFCVGIVGEVRARLGRVNDKMATGAVEVWVTKLEVFSKSEAPPFPIQDEVTANDSLRGKYRYLDLRRPQLQKNIIMRANATRATRTYLGANGFLEIETPFMVKYTPGGARNFLVPSRLNPGSFYALAESPQIFKQLLMVAGYERYFQITRCFRDEDLRLDRQPEFTQIDIEMSFVDEALLQSTMEGLIAALWKQVLGVELQLPLRRMTYAEAMEKYGVDKPDLRLDLLLHDVTDAARGSGVKMFEDAIAEKGIVKALRVPANEKISRSLLDSLTELGKQFRAKVVVATRIQDGGAWQASFAKTLTDGARGAINDKLGAQTGDVIVLVAEKAKVANAALGQIRLHVGEKLGLTRKGEYQFMWLTDPPLFEVDEETGAVAASHHPFTSPRVEDEHLLESAPGLVLARAYDLVLNGVELGGGSIRIHRSDLQARIFRALGITDEDARAKFGFLLDAFQYGPPPHGGIAFGLDRLAMLMANAESLRDVIAFPKTQSGSDLMTECPTPVSAKQLEELFIQLAPLPAK